MNKNIEKVQIVENNIKIDDFNINYVITKLKNSQPEHTLLLMPSTLGSSSLDFAPQLENLPQLLPNYQIISWDPPGYGKSIPPIRKFPINMFEIDAELAHKLMTLLDIKIFSILGLSGGGITAILMAIKFPQNVNKIIAVSCNSCITENEMKTYEFTKDVSKWNVDLREPLYDYYGANYVNESWRGFVDTLWRIFKELNGDFFSNKLSEITANVMIILGEKDGMISLDHGKLFTEKIKNCCFVIFKNGKHKVNLQYVDDFNAKVVEFLINKSKI